MLEMDQVHVIRHKVLIEGLSRRQVAKEMGVSRNTVRKYSREEAAEPRFRKPKEPRGRPVLDKVVERIDELLIDWSSRASKKQRITGARVHEQLLAEGFVVGASTVRSYVSEWCRKKQEVFVPLVHRAGDAAQVDFFEVTVELEGVRCKRWMFLIRLMHSGRDFAWLYEHCDQVSFLDGHVRAFAHFDGVPGRCVYDNLSAAVRKVLMPGRELTQRFKALVSHYLFEPCFARVGEGHDKGGVESRGKHVRWQHLVPIPRGNTLEEISQALLDRLDAQAKTRRKRDGSTTMDTFTDEKPMLRPVPHAAFEPRLVVLCAANRQALVTCKGGRYSLPSHWQRLDVTAYVGPGDVRFICREEVVTRTRVGRHEKNVQYRDYMKQLSEKPQAVRQVAPELLAELGEPFSELWQLLESAHGGREAGRVLARILGAIVKHDEATVTRSLGQALERGKRLVPDLVALCSSPPPSEISIPESLRQYVVESARAEDFNVLAPEVAS